jgi:hypothetical protein
MEVSIGSIAKVFAPTPAGNPELLSVQFTPEFVLFSTFPVPPAMAYIVDELAGSINKKVIACELTDVQLLPPFVVLYTPPGKVAVPA